MHITIKKTNTVSVTVAGVENATEAGRVSEDALKAFLGFTEKHPEFTYISIY